MSATILVSLFTFFGIIGFIVYDLGKIPSSDYIPTSIVEATTKPANQATPLPSPTPKSTPTSKPQVKGIQAIASPSPAPQIVECPVEKDGNKMLEIEECRKLVTEHNEAVQKRNAEIYAENQRVLEQYKADMAAYEAKRLELYNDCINQPIPRKDTRQQLPYYGAPYLVPQKTRSAAYIIEECKKMYGIIDPTPIP
jgi:hypothetical protein